MCLENDDQVGSSSILKRNTQGPFRSFARSNSQIMVEEFILGQLLRKIVITHPGQKMLNNVIESLEGVPLIKSPISIKSLMKTINSSYSEKIALCRDNQNYKKSELSMILYDSLTNMYGLKTVA